ncbi:MAG: preprotein translocase subunit SecD [bacterium ADurb.Bin270]|jgi:protein-export membrane protein SecD|nr:protein translocase subunit SecD [Myxococcales bacterium]OQA60915.1 MAG: preprotein translocase subunit SecD [bacterium ADurb.Bin270]HQG12803.1 protein translocase subunit SecD [bacterium]HQH79963.1 protein translocase subunit SecD [bacterium]
MMPNSWKWKLILLVGLILLSFYMLVPTFFGFAEKKEEAINNMTPLPWYFSIFPDKGINLGLDLRGGTYLEFEIDTSAAIVNQLDAMISDIERFWEKNKISGGKASQDTAKHRIIITGLTNDGASETIRHIRTSLDRMLKRVDASNTYELTFEPTDDFKKNLHSMIAKQSLEKVRNRIDRYGVAEPSIQRVGSNRIAVELPGIKDPDRAIGIIKQAGQLEFKIVNESIPEAKLVQMVADARKSGTLPENYSAETVAAINQSVKSELPADTEIAFELQQDPVTKKVVGATPYLLNRKAEVTGQSLKNAQVNVHDNEPYVSLTFDRYGAELFGEATKNNVGKRMAIMLDGNVMKAPQIREPILGGQAQITLGYGNFSDMQKEAEDLVLILQEGALPARMIEATKTVVGPSLGADSIRSGVIATLIGGTIIALFMIIYYKGSGLIANMALALNLLFILSALALLQATLTLPGIAGMAFTLGMAVDANIIIYERIREEIRDGKTPKGAIESGYSNAMRTIIDSNVTTLMAGIVLYQFGTGPIRGFAITLIIGLAISMYTACICTRMVYDYFVTKRKISSISI